MNLSEAEENYLKAIFYLCITAEETASTNAIATRLDTKAASVSDMLKKLAEKKLIHYKKYKGTSLSNEGNKIAIGLVRKHRLWEVFLVEKLGFKWDEVHDVAEQLEHIKSPHLVKKLDEFLSFPKFDPHGDPIPDQEGKIAKNTLQMLSAYAEGDMVLLKGVADTSVDFLQYLDQLDIFIGIEIHLGKKNTFDASQELLIGEKRIVVSQLVANNLLVEELIF